MSRTRVLLQLEVAHRYFADGRARGLRFEAAGDTARRMRRAGLLERQDGATLWLLGPADASATLSEDSPEPLIWWVRATDPDFSIYTDDPAQRPDEVLVVEAMPALAEPLDADTGRTAPAEADGAALATRNDVAATPPAPTVQVMKIWRGPVDADRPVPDDHFPLTGEAAWRPPFAVLQVPPSAWDLPQPQAQTQVPPQAQPQTQTQAQSPTPAPIPRPASRDPAALHLRWTLSPRQLVWKYCLFGDWSEDALDIVDADGQVSFNAPVPEHGVDGRPLLALRSHGPLALAERSDTRLQLRCRQSGVPKVLVKRLPVPGPQHLAREEIDGAATLVSEIHVHR